MKIRSHCLFLFLFIISGSFSWSQDIPNAYQWNVESRKISEGKYELIFTTKGNSQWLLYAPNQDLGGVPSVELIIPDSSAISGNSFKDSGQIINEQSALFEIPVNLAKGTVSWKAEISFPEQVPAFVQGELKYAYGKDLEFYQEVYGFSVALEGGVTTESRILIPSIKIKDPVRPCGDDDTEGKSLFGIFLLGFLGGLIALVTPCVFPLIPLTVSFFTKKSGSRGKGIRNALWYGLSIFLIYAVLSVPFHLVSQVNPEVLNNISTNVWLNLTFFIVFIFFALSFFGLFEIGLPSGFASRIDSKSGLSNFWGIFFMALTLAIVSFSCTGPILGSLLAGVLTNDNGATQLTFGMSGFGLGLALPFALFALFPNLLQSIPKSGGWLNDVKIVLGFLELALAVKFLSNADLVEQWGILKREVFMGIWVVISLLIVLYLCGWIRFGHSSKPKFSATRILFIVLFSAITLYLLPGVTNTKWARLSLISGFPPPFSYSIYKNPVNYETGVQPVHNDYDKALELALAENKPVLIDFTGWACVNCRKMEEQVWVDDKVKALMKNEFIVLSLYVDERTKLPVSERMEYTTRDSTVKSIITVGDKWATFQFENFYKVSQPQYAIISPDEIALTKTKTYTPSASEFAEWLECGLAAYREYQGKRNN